MKRISLVLILGLFPILANAGKLVCSVFEMADTIEGKVTVSKAEKEVHLEFDLEKLFLMEEYAEKDNTTVIKTKLIKYSDLIYRAIENDESVFLFSADKSELIMSSTGMGASGVFFSKCRKK